MQPRRRWKLPGPKAPLASSANALVRALHLTRPAAEILVRRGFGDVDAASRLLDPRREHLLDPFEMADMRLAAERLERALQQSEHVVVAGDYDADGVTGTALLVSELRKLGGRVDFFIPNRERDGYGITPRLVERAGAVGVRVLVSVDCGSSDHAAIETARGLGIDVIVVDHHEVPDPPQAACAVLNPKRADCAYPFKGLSAVGVAFKLLQAVCRLRGEPEAPREGLDLVVLGTLADVQPVVGENRALTWLGLQALDKTPRPGLRALRRAAGIEDRVGSRQVGFRIVPRLNAAGRVASGKLAVDLLLAPDDRSAEALATEMEAQNRWRQALEQVATQAALERAEAAFRAGKPAALVLASENWHPGIVGISAARVVQKFGVPAAVIGIQNGVGRGSVRTTGEVDVRAALALASDLLVRFGGHREAAGFTIDPAQIEAFGVRFEAAVRQSAGVPDSGLEVDGELDPADLGPALVHDLERLEPFGSHHPEPLFLLRDLEVGPATRVVGRDHLKLQLQPAGGGMLDGIAFGWAERLRPADAIGRRLDAVGHLRRQDPRFGGDLQFVVIDLASAAAAPGSAARRPEPG